ncbi:tetratricopeptide repeat protein [uncultured Vibrio sp.]|uniref:tetratricopeptide repeat protein n=1 Tax=uncultured Vibrio sp. TaxID=114054 RepID=UPI0029C73875|nr:tetratricopeptide repeat protein [uncultured Vibrio sp.]
MKIIAVMSLSLFLVMGCSTTTHNEENVVTSMQRVENHSGLISHYKLLLEQNPDDVQVMQELAHVYLEKGDVESAKFYVQYLLDKGIENALLVQLRGQIHSQEGEDSLALEQYQRAIAMGHDTGEIQVLSGIAYSNLGDFSLAERAFNQARLKGYNDVAIKNNLAVVHLAQQQYDDVIVLLAPVYQENPNNEKVRANLAIALFKTGDVSQARELLEDAFTDAQVAQISRKLHR